VETQIDMVQESIGFLKIYFVCLFSVFIDIAGIYRVRCPQMG